MMALHANQSAHGIMIASSTQNYADQAVNLSSRAVQSAMRSLDTGLTEMFMCNFECGAHPSNRRASE
jgi:hypothetical protein